MANPGQDLRTIGSLDSGIIDKPRVNPLGDVGGVRSITCDGPCHRSVHDRVTEGYEVAGIVHGVLIRNELSISVHY